jgi:hypothetical protein
MYPLLRLLLLLLPQPALATPEFPGVLETALDMPCAPPCAVCHWGSPGSGTATSPLARALVRRGLRASDRGSLEASLLALEDDAVDGDADGLTDVEELSVGTDPNPGGESFCETPPPQWGCLDHARGGRSGWGATLGGLLLLMALTRRAS